MAETRIAAGAAAGGELERIMETYRRAWETRDAELVVSLFTKDATYRQDPFSKAFAGHAGIRRYWQEATGGHREVQFRWRPISTTGNLHVVEWEAKFTRIRSRRRVELRGVMLVELRGERIFRFREYWHRKDNV